MRIPKFSMSNVQYRKYFLPTKGRQKLCRLWKGLIKSNHNNNNNNNIIIIIIAKGESWPTSNGPRPFLRNCAASGLPARSCGTFSTFNEKTNAHTIVVFRNGSYTIVSFVQFPPSPTRPTRWSSYTFLFLFLNRIDKKKKNSMFVERIDITLC